MADPRPKLNEGKGLGQVLTFPWARVELASLLLLTVVAGVIRFWRINDIGLSHFDAGIYAQSALWPWTGSLHPLQGYYSPPLFPFLWGLLNLAAGGPLDWGGVAISAAAGTLLIPAGWYLGRQWFGILGGLAAATFLCFDGLQILFSRVALTDSLFTLLFLTTLGLGVKWIRQEQSASRTQSGSRKGRYGWTRLALLVLVATCCLYTKYNGLMPIGLVGLYAFVRRPGLTSIKQAALILLPALILYSPWVAWFHVQHGYETLLAHQRGYLAPIEDWPANLLRMMHWRAMNSTQSFSLWLLTVGGVILRKHGEAVLALGCCCVLAMPNQWFSDTVFLLALFSFGRARRSDRWSLLVIYAAVLAAPLLYSPYLRLWLPTTALWTTAAGGGVAFTLKGFGRSSPSGIPPLAIAVAIACSVFVFGWANSERMKFWANYAYRPHTGYRPIVEEVVPKVAEGGTVYALTRPPVHYYLRGAGIEVAPLDGGPFDLARLGPTDWLLVDRTAEDNPAFARSIFESPMAIHVLNRIEELPLDIDLVTLLDGARSDEDLLLSISEDARDERLVIYRRK